VAALASGRADLALGEGDERVSGQVCTRVPDDVLLWLASEARRRGVPVAAVVRDLLVQIVREAKARGL
jgi:hypothetical protein